MLGHSREMAAVVASMQDASMNLRMQRLNAPIQHFGKSGQLRNIFYGNAGIAQQLGGASSRNQFDTQLGKLTGEIDQSGFIGNAKNGAGNFLSLIHI